MVISEIHLIFDLIFDFIFTYSVGTPAVVPRGPLALPRGLLTRGLALLPAAAARRVHLGGIWPWQHWRASMELPLRAAEAVALARGAEGSDARGSWDAHRQSHCRQVNH